MPNENVIMPEDYKDIVYRATYFLLGKVAHHVPRSITPNQITTCAFLLALMGCALLYFVKSPAAYLYWALFNFLWYVFDALDGIHARLTQQTSEFGAFLDHFLDNIFFIFMFTVFVFKFDLSYPLYIFILLLRFTAAISVFIAQVHTGKLYLSKFSGGLELILMTTAMILSYCFPHFNLSQHVTNTTLLYMVNLFNLHQGVFMKLVLLFYIIGVPAHFVVLVNHVRREIGQGNGVKIAVKDSLV